MTTLPPAQITRKLARKASRTLQHSTEDVWRLLTGNFQERAIANKKELRIIGLRRTGNHTVAEWIKAQEPGAIEHLNNLEVRCNPYRYKYEMLIDHYPEHHNWAYKHYQPLAKGRFPEIDCLICGYEDHPLGSIADPLFEQLHDAYVGKSAKRFDILVLRDPFNLFASRLKSNMIPVKSAKFTAVDLWIQYAKEFLGETQYLNHNRIAVNYNQWVTDVDYRQQLAAQLGLEFSDTGIKKVASLGGGSSFDGSAMDGKGDQMAVLERWQHFKDDEAYRALFKNRQLLEYSQKIFGDMPNTDILFDD
ncbi:hypothetical protein [Halomicronema sp. CCY15110]|uniref:hypothetical protein n=1 Tax=Halomicronema sp. CCY15110 TaxID=2767773 RepID=UPI0019525119|nr:hypothetical protein [Halomicronema sp. CCY15110]